MAFGDDPSIIDELKAKLEKRKSEKLNKLILGLVKDYGLNKAASVDFDALRGGDRIFKVRINDRGVITRFTITLDDVVLESHDSLNEDREQILEEPVIKEHENALRDYFHDHPEDRPED